MLYNSDLHTEETVREESMRQRGIERHFQRTKEARKSGLLLAQNQPLSIISAAHPKISRLIEADIEIAEQKVGHKSLAWLRDIRGISFDLLSYIVLSSCYQATTKGWTRTAAALQIGRLIEIEKEAHDRRNSSVPSKVSKDGEKMSEGEVFKSMEAAAMRKAGTNWQRKAKLKAKIEYLDFSKIAKWDVVRCKKVSVPLLNIVLENSNVFTTVVRSKKSKTEERITLTDDAHLAIKKGEAWEEWQEPMLAPMIVPPRCWESTTTGCYLDQTLASLVPLVRNGSDEQNSALEHLIRSSKEAGTGVLKNLGDSEQQLPDFLTSLNLLQKTPLKINVFVLNALSWAWAKGCDFGKFPKSSLLQESSKLSPEEFGALSKVQKSAAAEKIRSIKDRNLGIKSAQSLMEQDLTCAFELADYDQFYLGWNMDTRGRVYPVSSFSYHRDDHIKALFLLARGKAIDAEGLKWLMIHAANVYDFEKVSNKPFVDRELWFQANKDKILEVAGDIEGTFDFWSKADKPFQFLAACDAYATFLEDGQAYLCGIPTALDGTNSGVQHYSAASKNSKDGALVNLVPSESPQDVYQKVAELTVGNLRAILNCNSTADTAEELEKEERRKILAEKWLNFGINRKHTKRNTMCFGYNSAVSGFADQIFEDFLKPLNYSVIEGVIERHPFGDTEQEQRTAARFLAEINYSSVQETVQSAEAGMNFLKSCASALGLENKPVRWTTPSGFIVVHKYPKKIRHALKLFMYDTGLQVKKRKQATVISFSPDIDRRKSMAAVSANFVHSMDSSHLLSTILKASRPDVDGNPGMRDFFVIHDSFGSVPCETPAMYRSVREAFVEMYQDRCVFTDLLNEVQSQLKKPDRICANDIPPKGDLCISEIRNAKYCFS